MSEKFPLVVLGGTFDPVHYGHLRLAENLRNLMPDAEIRMMPSANPPLRGIPDTSAEQRLAMLVRALEESPHLTPDDRELRRIGASYTLSSMQELAQEFPERSLILVLGSDAYAQFPQWHRWQELLSLVTLLVVSRPQADLDSAESVRKTSRQLKINVCESIEELIRAKCQAVYYHTAPMLDISATQIRQLIANRQSVRFLLPQSVIEYIHQHKLYLCQSTNAV